MSKKNKSEAPKAPAAETGQSQSETPASQPLPSGAEIQSQLPARIVPSKSMVELFSAPALAPGKRERLTLPPIVKPAAVSAGISIIGKIVKVIESPHASFKQDLLVMEHPSGREYCFPACAVIRKALVTRYGEFTPASHSKLVGAVIQIDGLGKTNTVDGKRTVNLFEVSLITP